MTKKNSLLRAASVRSTSFNADENTVEVVWTTGAAVQRFDWSDGEYSEVLSLDSSAVRLERLNAGAPFLNTHASWALENVIGSVVPGSARIEDGKGVALIKLSGAADDADTIGKIRDGVIRNISVGYWVHAFEEKDVNGATVRTATDWEPLEISAVPVPADAGAQVRSLDRRRRPEAPRAAPAKKVSARIAEIRRLARKARKPNFGEKHVRLGTSADDFFWLLAEQLGLPKREQMADHKSKEQRDYERGAAAARRVLGKRDDASDNKPDDAEDEDRDDDTADEVETCPSCGKPLDDGDDEDGDDTRDDDDKNDKKSDGDSRRGRSIRFGGTAVRSAPVYRSQSSRAAGSGSREPAPHSSKIQRSDIERGAAHFRKLAGK